MCHRKWLRYWHGAVYFALLAWASGREGTAQVAPTPDSPLVNPRSELPFGTLPQQLPGPPRGEGELPEGASMPPSTLPGRMSGPPRAQGYSPFAPFLVPDSDLVTPGSMPGPFQGLSPLPGPVMELPQALPGADIEAGTPRGGGPDSPWFPSIRFDDGAAKPRPGSANLNDRIVPSLPRPPAAPGPGARPRSLLMEDVLDSAERSYPPFQAYLEERMVAAGHIRSAQGSFDLNLNVDARNWGLGYYKRNLFDVFFEQPTTLWGTKFFWGWRLGVGDWPIYYQYLQTSQGGAYVTGMDVPLLRGGRIDPKRAKLWQSQLERQKVEPAISKQRIDLFKNAAKAYWNWVAAGQSYAVYEGLLKLAEVRTRFLERQVQLGALSPIELKDNLRVVLGREIFLINARRRFQQAAIELSLYLRDSQGMPEIPDPRTIPKQFPTTRFPDGAGFTEDLEVAIRLRPEVRVLQLEYRKAGIELELAQNSALPSMNFYTYGEQNVGQQPPLQNKGPYVLEASILFDVPIQRRVAKGRIQAVNAELRQATLQIQFARDRVVADVKDAMANLQASHEQMTRYQESVTINEALEKAEKRRFGLGSSTVFFLTLREQATADSRVAAIESMAKYLSALAEYRAALAIDALPPREERGP